jgi:hypothetical protein
MVLAEAYSALENVGGFGGKGDLLNSYEMWRHDPAFLVEQLHRYEAVTGEEVQRAARESLGGARVVLHVVPEGGAR